MYMGLFGRRLGWRRCRSSSLCGLGRDIGGEILAGDDVEVLQSRTRGLVFMDYIDGAFIAWECSCSCPCLACLQLTSELSPMSKLGFLGEKVEFYLENFNRN